MNCCMCNGVCMHVGPHSYCSAHGGGVWPGMRPPWQEPTPWTAPATSGTDIKFFPEVVVEECDQHCMCMVPTEDELGDRLSDHMKCCNCGRLFKKRNS